MIAIIIAWAALTPHVPDEGKLKDTIHTPASVVSITSCMSDVLSKRGRADVVDRPGGSKSVRWFMEAPSFSKAAGDPTLTFEVTEGDDRQVDLYTTWIVPRPGKLWTEIKAKCLGMKS